MCITKFQHGQTNVSTEETQTRANPRISCAHEDKRRPQNSTGPSSHGPYAPCGLISVFPRQERLARAAFPTLFAGGRRFSSAHFTALASEEGKGYAVVVSKKVARLSVTRHRIKRRVLEALRAIPLPRSLILFPKSPVNSMSSQDIQNELTGLLSKIRR